MKWLHLLDSICPLVVISELLLFWTDTRHIYIYTAIIILLFEVTRIEIFTNKTQHVLLLLWLLPLLSIHVVILLSRMWLILLSHITNVASSTHRPNTIIHPLSIPLHPSGLQGSWASGPSCCEATVLSTGPPCRRKCDNNINNNNKKKNHCY